MRLRGAFAGLPAPARWLILATLPLGLYLAVSARTYGLGFPLDDAWIHQTYARNLATRFEWAFVPGAPSAGSTAPLWTAALSLGHALHLDPRLWAYLMGWLILGGLAWSSSRWLEERNPGASRWAWLGGVLVLVEWHLAWAALSGMETLGLALFAVVAMRWADSRRIDEALLGALIGLGVWVRPDALTLLLPALWSVITRERPSRAAALRLAKLAGGAMLLVAPYLAFNRALSGAWWPSTFYAKQAEYAVLRQAPLAARLAAQLLAPMVGAGVLLAPGVLLGAWQSLRTRRLDRLAPLLWALAYLGSYAWRLPVTYQHGRYAMPTIPVVLMLGLEGLLGWGLADSVRPLRRSLARAWLLAAATAGVTFLPLGARAYAEDVAIIETEMVAAARWIGAQTDPGALIAAHDIGALGYFGGRPILDLAGLASPDVIPFIRDEARLASFINRQGARYLMTFPGWYPSLVRQAEPVYTTHGVFSPRAGGENMTVYRWRGPAFAP